MGKDLVSSVGVGAEMKERVQSVVWYKAGNKTGKLEWTVRKECNYLIPCLEWLVDFPGEVILDFGGQNFLYFYNNSIGFLGIIQY